MATQITTDDSDLMKQLRPLADQRTSLHILGVEFRSTGEVTMASRFPDNVMEMTINLVQVRHGT